MQEYAEMLMYKIFIQKDTISLYFKFHGKFIEKFCCSYLKGPVAVTFCIRSRDSEEVFGT